MITWSWTKTPQYVLRDIIEPQVVGFLRSQHKNMARQGVIIVKVYGRIISVPSYNFLRGEIIESDFHL